MSVHIHFGFRGGDVEFDEVGDNHQQSRAKIERKNLLDTVVTDAMRQRVQNLWTVVQAQIQAMTPEEISANKPEYSIPQRVRLLETRKKKDGTVKTYGPEKNEFSNKDLASLRRKGWLTRTVIDEFFIYLNEAEESYCRRAKQNTNVMFLTNEDVIGLYRDEENRETFLNPEYKHVPYFGLVANSSAVFPGNHWVLFFAHCNRTAELSDLTIYYYDPYGNDVALCADKRRATKVLEKVFGMESNFMDLKGPKQDNGYDCGVFALAMAFFLRTRPEILAEPSRLVNGKVDVSDLFRPDQIDDFRIILANRLFNETGLTVRSAVESSYAAAGPSSVPRQEAVAARPPSVPSASAVPRPRDKEPEPAEDTRSIKEILRDRCEQQ